MKEQSVKNHARVVPGYHYVAAIALLATFIGSIINLLHCAQGNCYSASLITVLTFAVILIWAYTRIFALKAQDRAIRAEENLRHFILTGKPFDTKLRIDQIIALRFAGDDEFVGLTKRAIEENLSGKDIKQAIQNWKADYYRV